MERRHDLRKDGKFLLDKDSNIIIQAHPSHRGPLIQGYVVLRIEPAYREYAPQICAALNRWREQAPTFAAMPMCILPDVCADPFGDRPSPRSVVAPGE